MITVSVIGKRNPYQVNRKSYSLIAKSSLSHLMSSALADRSSQIISRSAHAGSTNPPKISQD